MADKARMTLQPWAAFLARMRGDIGADHVDRRDGRGNGRIKRAQERDTLAWALAAVTLSVDSACPGIKGREQVQRPIAPIRMLDAVGDARLGRFRGREPGPRLQRGCFLEAENHLMRLQRAGGERDEGGHWRIAGRIARMLRRQPPMRAPRVEFMMGENAADR